MNFREKGIPNKQEDPDFLSQQITSISEFEAVLKGLGQISILEGSNIKTRLITLIDRVKEANKQLFVFSIESNNWAVVASSQAEIEKIKDRLKPVVHLQTQIELNTL